MSDNNSGSVVVTAVMQHPTQSFLDDKIDLKKLSKDLSKASKEAVEVLLKLLESKDERVRMTAATKLLEFDIDVKKIVSQDQMQRLIAELKLNRAANVKTIGVDEDEKQRPLVDFYTVREVE
jgi:HEAT repeat protein